MVHGDVASLRSEEGHLRCQIQRTLGISYKTAWYLCHRIRAAMKEAAKTKLDWQGRDGRNLIGGGTKERPAASDNKEIVIGIRQRNGELRLFHANDVKAGTLASTSERTSKMWT